MSRLPQLTPVKMIAALKRAGFVQTHTHGSHVYLKHPLRGSRTMVAMHRKDLTRALIHEIIDQAGLEVEEFLDFL